MARAPTPASRASALGRPGATGSVIERRVDPFEFLSCLAAEVSKGTVNLPCFPDIVLRIRKALPVLEARLAKDRGDFG